MAHVPFDILIRGGRIVDGSGSPWYRGDAAVAGDRIAAVGALGGAPARRIVEAEGKVVCPGFVDLHTHGDLVHLANPDCAPRVMQGVTTDVIGQDGLSYAPVDGPTLAYFRTAMKPINGDPPGLSYDWRSVEEFLARFDGKTSINVAYLVPHAPVRVLAMGGAVDRRPTESEMRHMKDLVDRGMRQGCVGFSTGLTYAPMSFASAGEIAELCSVAGQYGGAFMPHLRSYGTKVVEAMDEAIDIARTSGIALHLTHHQVVFPINEGRVQAYLDVIDRARADGMDVTCDSYPYVAGSTFLRGFFPGWTQRMSILEFVDALSDPTARVRIRHELEDVGCDGSHGVPIDWTKVQISGVKTEKNAGCVGKRIADAARQAGTRPFDFAAELLAAEEGEVACVTFFGFENAVQAIMRHPAHMVASDAILTGAKPHPRAWGCHARYLARYVRELGILRLEEAIRKMTAAPAARIGLSDRGLVKAGLAADLVVFDPAMIRDTATFEDPRRHPTGVQTVIVNGRVVVDDGKHTHERAGRALKPAR